MSKAPLYIPPHMRCIDCGKCCGPVPISAEEYANIYDYLQEHAYPREVAERPHTILECVFRDNEKRCCSIYPVRPTICRLFGVTAGMQCLNGNSAEIDGKPFLEEWGFFGIQNMLFGGDTQK